MAQEKQGLPHKLNLDEREKLTMTGVEEVLHFDEEMARLNTSRGEVSVYGSDLKLRTLSLEGGTVCVVGMIEGIVYEQNRRREGWGRLWK